MMPNDSHHQDVSLEKCAWHEEVFMELTTQVALGTNTSETDLRTSFEFMRVLWKRCSTNGRLIFVTVLHVDDLFCAYDTRCKTTKSLLEARRFYFLRQTRSGDTRSLARQSRICGLIPCSDGIEWNPAISRNHVDIQRTLSISQSVGKTPMVATSITSRSVIRSDSCSTTFQRTHGC